MRIGSGLFLLGILTLMQFRDLPATLPVGILTLILVVLSRRYRLLRHLACYLCGFFWCLYISNALLSQHLPATLEGTSVNVLGYVSSLPTVSDHYLQFDFELIRLYDSKGRLHHGPEKIRLNWYKPYPELTAGQSLSLEVRLKRPHGYISKRSGLPAMFVKLSRTSICWKTGFPFTA
jgi:competence protein ComEC